MLKRKVSAQLLEWRAEKHKDCLLLRGARGVGKTTLVEDFGRTYYRSFVTLNFRNSPELRVLFEGRLNAAEIYKRIALLCPQTPVIPGESLLFLDEIEFCPQARSTFKMLALDGRCDVIAAGNPIEPKVKTTEKSEDLIPLSYAYEKEIVLYGLDFEEYLWAHGYNQDVLHYLHEYAVDRSALPLAIHHKMNSLMRNYSVVGGMPDAVIAELRGDSMAQIQWIQEQIIETQLEDLELLHGICLQRKAKDCFLIVPAQLAKANKRFQFSLLEKGGNARKYQAALDGLAKLNLLHFCTNVSAPHFPLVANEQDEGFKIYFGDIGLYMASCGLEAKELALSGKANGTFASGRRESLVADILLKNGYKLRYYKDPNSVKEVEFLISREATVIPIEVKARGGLTPSAREILTLPDIPFVLKAGESNVRMHEQVIEFPFYLLAFL